MNGTNRRFEKPDCGIGRHSLAVCEGKPQWSPGDRAFRGGGDEHPAGYDDRLALKLLDEVVDCRVYGFSFGFWPASARSLIVCPTTDTKPEWEGRETVGSTHASQ